MAHTKEEYAEAKKQKKELFNLLLKKTGVSKQEWLEILMQDFIKENVNILTEKEKKQFDLLVF